MTVSGSSDAELVARAREGDHAAFGELVDRHRSAVFRAALAALGSAADAEDAAQDAFVSAFTRLHTFRGHAAFKTWLLTIAWNHALNRRRSLVRWWRQSTPGWQATRGDEADAETGVEPRSPAPTPEQQTLDARLRRDIACEIRALPPKLRDALLLAQAGDYSYDEIAAMLGAAVGTIKWRVSEARRVIRKRLQARGYASL